MTELGLRKIGVYYEALSGNLNGGESKAVCFRLLFLFKACRFEFVLSCCLWFR